MNVEKELKDIVASVLENHSGIFLVEFKHHAGQYEITIDGDQALGIYDISAVSREINHIADEKMPEESYSLDISSPGADSNLLLLRQFPKHKGREFMVTLIDGSEFKAKLTDLEGEELHFATTASGKPGKKVLSEAKKVNYTEIKKANIILSFK